jgi:16S rRNA (guanine527-N7)-methyltransferase
MNCIQKYFPQLSGQQTAQFAALDALYHEWNEKINVISRRDIDNLYLHHVLHSLAIGKACQFRQGCSVLDVGTGGGFPGIPLAILFPECQFTLIDGTGKKIRVAQEVCRAIGLKNCQPVHRRAEEEKGRYQFVVSRAVMPLPDLVRLVRKNVTEGLFCLKGGDLQEELRPFRDRVRQTELTEWFDEEWFREKYCIYLPL